ncbi:MAG: hypothetical protein HPY85_16750, partial [Anaerolineae bacterium]|nr:hypothetical protein [Anaerolineae bacterium]
TPRDHNLRIDGPGPLSKLVSPILYDVYIRTGADGTALVELIGEDGRLITSDSIYRGADRYFRAQQYLEFTIPGVSELARLQFTARDANGRVTAMSSVDVVLLAMGEDVLNPAYFQLDPYIVWEPKKDAVISGGVAWVDGLAYPVNDQPVILELLDANGEVIASRLIELPEVKEGHTHTRFDVGISYTVTGRTPALLVMRQESANRIAGTVYLSSVPVVLEP